MSQRFAVVHEAEADFETATELADRVLIEAIEWLDQRLIADQRMWVATTPGGRRLSWKEMPKLARATGVKAHGHFDGEPGAPDASAARRAILYLLATMPDAKAILLIRDQDDQPERRDGLEQARRNDRSGIIIIIGLAVVERESWLLSGFDPRNDEETARLQLERQRLGFNPCERSHELTACKNDQADHSPKRVLRQLSNANRDRQRCCWNDTPLEVLRQRGTENGLAAYLHEARDRLGQLIGHVVNG